MAYNYDSHFNFGSIWDLAGDYEVKSNVYLMDGDKVLFAAGQGDTVQVTRPDKDKAELRLVLSSNPEMKVRMSDTRFAELLKLEKPSGETEVIGYITKMVRE